MPTADSQTGLHNLVARPRELGGEESLANALSAFLSQLHSGYDDATMAEATEAVPSVASRHTGLEMANAPRSSPLGGPGAPLPHRLPPSIGAKGTPANRVLGAQRPKATELVPRPSAPPPPPRKPEVGAFVPDPFTHGGRMPAKAPAAEEVRRGRGFWRRPTGPAAAVPPLQAATGPASGPATVSRAAPSAPRITTAASRPGPLPTRITPFASSSSISPLTAAPPRARPAPLAPGPTAPGPLPARPPLGAMGTALAATGTSLGRSPVTAAPAAPPDAPEVVAARGTGSRARTVAAIAMAVVLCAAFGVSLAWGHHKATALAADARQLALTRADLGSRESGLSAAQARIARQLDNIRSLDTRYSADRRDLTTTRDQLAKVQAELDRAQFQLSQAQGQVGQTESQLGHTQANLSASQALAARCQQGASLGQQMFQLEGAFILLENGYLTALQAKDTPQMQQDLAQLQTLDHQAQVVGAQFGTAVGNCTQGG